MEQIPLSKLFNPNISRKNIIETTKDDMETLTNVEVESVRTDVTPVKVVEEKHHDNKSADSGADSESESGSDTRSEASDMDKNMENRQNDEKFKELHDIRRGLHNRIGRFRNLGFKIPEMKGNEGVDELIKIVDSLEYEKRYATNIRFFRQIIGFLGWVIEAISLRIGFKSLKGFSHHINSLSYEFDEFYDDMTEPTYVKSDEGEYVKIEKRNIINYVNTKTELAICMRFFLMAASYSAASKFDTLAELMA